VLLLLPRAVRRSEPGAAGVILALGGSSKCRLALIAGVASCRLGRLGSTRSRLLGAAPALNSRKEAGVAADLRRVLPTDCVAGEYCSSRDMLSCSVLVKKWERQPGRAKKRKIDECKQLHAEGLLHGIIVQQGARTSNSASRG
jgi:hypothetical protein